MMTYQEIDQLKAGPALNALVAEYVMGWQWVKHHPQQVAMPGYQGDNPRFLADPRWIESMGNFPFVVAADGTERVAENPLTSNAPDWSGTWEGVGLVVKEMRGVFQFELRQLPSRLNSEFWAYFGTDMAAIAKTAPEAVAKAALKVAMTFLERGKPRGWAEL